MGNSMLVHNDANGFGLLRSLGLCCLLVSQTIQWIHILMRESNAEWPWHEKLVFKEYTILLFSFAYFCLRYYVSPISRPTELTVVNSKLELRILEGLSCGIEVV
ncbi:hypothetical protein SDJN02_26074, partial [Cucurbita argyrosperma subsp. argyrosperma]